MTTDGAANAAATASADILAAKWQAFVREDTLYSHIIYDLQPVILSQRVLLGNMIIIVCKHKLLSWGTLSTTWMKEKSNANL